MKKISKHRFIEIREGTVKWDDLQDCHCDRIPELEAELVTQAEIIASEDKQIIVLKQEVERLREENKNLIILLSQVYDCCIPFLEDGLYKKIKQTIKKGGVGNEAD